jgi:hypothetical protein
MPNRFMQKSQKISLVAMSLEETITVICEIYVIICVVRKKSGKGITQKIREKPAGEKSANTFLFTDKENYRT